MTGRPAAQAHGLVKRHEGAIAVYSADFEVPSDPHRTSTERANTARKQT